MTSFLRRIHHFFAKAPSLFVPYRWLILCVFLLSSAFMLFGMMTRFTMDMSLESWFQKDDPATLSLDQFRREFGSDDGVYIVYQAKDGDVFSAQSLATLAALHQALDEARFSHTKDEKPSLLSRVERIDSLINVRYQKADCG